VGGSDYGSVRAAAFMGRTIAGTIRGVDLDHLTEMAPHAFERDIAAALPETMVRCGPSRGAAEPHKNPELPNNTKLLCSRAPAQTGAQFLDTHGSHGDPVTAIQPTTVYAPRAAVRHAVHEHHRVSAFAQLLRGSASDEQLAVLGQLMLQSHCSYSSVGLGSDGTDAIVALVEELGPSRGLFGAKITGGGSGGTVCILGRAGADAAVHEVAARYAAASGQTPYVFCGSSPGAMAFGTLSSTVHV
jgi:L-arabinokinase